MASEIRQAHDELLALVSALEELTAVEQPDRDSLAHARWRLSRASGRRFKLLDDKVYPLLLARCSAAEAEPVLRLRDAYGGQREATRLHVLRWTIDTIVADWAGYKRASAATRETMRSRIAEEKAVLYPLLDKYAEPVPAIT